MSKVSDITDKSTITRALRAFMRDHNEAILRADTPSMNNCYCTLCMNARTALGEPRLPLSSSKPDDSNE